MAGKGGSMAQVLSATEKVISDEIVLALARADVLDAFSKLTKQNQHKLSAWVTKAGKGRGRHRRLNTLVVGLRISRMHPDSLERSEGEAH
jgi:uncharacterized protein YdeI (YjbR/CyaY-like superfamily)